MAFGNARPIKVLVSYSQLVVMICQNCHLMSIQIPLYQPFQQVLTLRKECLEYLWEHHLLRREEYSFMNKFSDLLIDIGLCLIKSYRVIRFGTP